MSLLSFLFQSCLFENPEETDDGQLGIDPTNVTVRADITLNMTMPSASDDTQAFVQPPCDGTDYRRRVIVSAVTEGRMPVTRTILLDIAEGAEKVVVPVTLKLNARDYDLMVWSDYVRVADNTVDSTYFYNASMLPNVYMSTAYRGNNAFKDAACASARLLLAQYRNEWNAAVDLELALERPVARMQLTADDTAAFLDRISAGEIIGTAFSVRISYPGYLCMGYNVVENVPRHSLMYMTYEHAFNIRSLTAGEPFMLTCDYLFADSGANTAIPVQVEIMNTAKTEVYASTSFTAYCRAGFCTDIRYGFLTAKNDQGVTFDPGYAGNGTVVVPALPATK